uniref:Uncharacterized protein n=1 Tax=Rhizophora mucronata TaxID=61149 RepID=A0A2P2NG20_RHIMU
MAFISVHSTVCLSSLAFQPQKYRSQSQCFPVS